MVFPRTKVTPIFSSTVGIAVLRTDRAADFSRPLTAAVGAREFSRRSGGEPEGHPPPPSSTMILTIYESATEASTSRVP
jgi:hypothetical protein